MAEELKIQHCSQCDQDKPIDKFYKIRKPGWQVTFCNDCVAINIKNWQQNGQK